MAINIKFKDKSEVKKKDKYGRNDLSSTKLIDYTFINHNFWIINSITDKHIVFTTLASDEVKPVSVLCLLGDTSGVIQGEPKVGSGYSGETMVGLINYLKDNNRLHFSDSDINQSLRHYIIHI